MNKKIKRTLFGTVMTILPICLICLLMWKFYPDNAEKNNSVNVNNTKTEGTIKEKSNEKKVNKTDILLTFLGDNTLGTDAKLSKSSSLPAFFENSGKDYNYFFQNVQDILQNDNLTIANLETAFTTSEDKKDKGTGTVYHFKGDPDYVNILANSSIDTVNLSNNHTYDYGQIGFQDTVKALEDASIGYFGENYKYTKEIKGVKFGFLGYQGFYISDNLKEKISNDINTLRDAGCEIIIPYFHWGTEKEEKPNDTQIALAHFVIDSGADMVVGSHSHVMQTLENYNGKLIAYSLANFCFGGNSNPSDKRTFMLQVNFKFEDDVYKDTEFKVIPTRISSTDSYNDYRPTPYEDSKKEEVLQYINSLSPTFEGSISDNFISIN